MSITVLLFAQLRDIAGTNELQLTAHKGMTARDLLACFTDINLPALADALQDHTAMVSVNQQYAGWDAVLQDGDEVGLLPPVSGG